MKILAGIIAVLLSFTIIYGNDLVGHEFEIPDNEQNFDQFAAVGDIDTIWGAINNDSVRVGIQMGYEMNLAEGSIAAWNVTVKKSRIMDGIRLRSFNNTGAVGDIIDGGIGYDFATFMLVSHSNYLYFIVDAYENYTSSLITSTTAAPVPDVIIKEWGAINYASKVILPYYSYVVWSNPGVISESSPRINATKIIDGIRLTSRNNTVRSAEILEGGIGFDFATIKVLAVANFLDYSVTFFENGTYLETREIVYGTIDNFTKLEEKRFQNYPEVESNAVGNASFSTSGTFRGIRLTYLNYTDGRYEITSGGINESSVAFDFRGSNPGEPYDFKIEIFGNSAASFKMSIVFVTVLILIFNVLK